MRRILVPVDGSDGSSRAARFGAYIASETGAEVTLLHVYDAPTAAALGLAAMGTEVARETIERVARGSFDAALAQMREFQVPTDTHVAVGVPGKEIVTFARSYHPQLIVMGTRGRSPLEETLLGSVSDYVIRHAPCPVTVHR